MARPRAAPGTECEAVRCGRAGCVAVEGEGSCVAIRSEETEDFNFKRFSP
jgi:Fe2+ transport system protein FeoA